MVTATGLDPASLLDEMRGMGDCRVVADLSAVPELESINPEHCHLSWKIQLTTTQDANAIRDVFIFVEDESVIEIAEDSAAPAAPPPEPVRAKAVSASPKPAPAPEKAAPQPPPAKTPDDVPAAADKGPQQRSRRLPSDSTVRVASDKLDRLVNLVGELVMNQSRLADVSTRIDNAELSSPVEAIERLVAELRDSVLGIRMMPIGSTFNRYRRLVHDLSQELGKEVNLVIEGAETELDKTVLDQLGEPFVHLIRNALDHAIETPAERLAAGKPRQGLLRLTASHEGSHVMITIQDDGRGIDPARVRAKAVEQQLIAPDAVLSEREVYNLIFLPGFSTASSVTSVSGRGVGMDAVRKQIDSLRGSIDISSQVGKGTSVRLALPLTLAIIEGLLVELDGSRFIIPMAAVMENVELHASERGRQNGRNLVTVRGELIPYVRLRDLFDIEGREPSIEKIVITRHEGGRVGLVVDRVLGSHQTVIQSLGRFYRDIRVCSGATIMGDGSVALILNLSGLISMANERCARERPEHGRPSASHTLLPADRRPRGPAQKLSSKVVA